MTQKLIVLMIDGVSADYYAAERGRLPHLASIEARGFRVERLHAEVLGTSLPGRVSMMTGVTADVSGVYGNKIWDGARFRYPTPAEVRVPTLPARAKAAGKRVGVVGFGMLHPKDADIFRAPWWAGEFIQRARDDQPEQASEGWREVALHRTHEDFARACAEAGVPSDLPQIDLSNPALRAFFPFMADQQMLDWVGVLAASAYAPDLIIAEFLNTDTVQHNTGYSSPFSHWSVSEADMAVGRVLARLRAAGQEDQWNIAVMSDHGHSPIETALFINNILPDATMQSEGSILLTVPKDAAELAAITETLAAYGCEPYPNTCLPLEQRETVHLFVAPLLTSFETAPEGVSEMSGKPSAISSHGLRPGSAGDDRFAVFAGPDVPHGHVDEARAVQVAPTLANILGLPLDGFMGSPLF